MQYEAAFSSILKEPTVAYGWEQTFKWKCYLLFVISVFDFTLKTLLFRVLTSVRHLQGQQCSHQAAPFSSVTEQPPASLGSTGLPPRFAGTQCASARRQHAQETRQRSRGRGAWSRHALYRPSHCRQDVCWCFQRDELIAAAEDAENWRRWAI